MPKQAISSRHIDDLNSIDLSINLCFSFQCTLHTELVGSLIYMVSIPLLAVPKTDCVFMIVHSR